MVDKCRGSCKPVQQAHNEIDCTPRALATTRGQPFEHVYDIYHSTSEYKKKKRWRGEGLKGVTGHGYKGRTQKG